MDALPNNIEGRAYAPLSSRQVPARLIHRPLMITEKGDPEKSLYIDIVGEDGKVIGGAPMNEITIDPPLGQQPRRMQLPDGTMFETDARGAIQRITGFTRGGQIHALEQFRPRLLAVVAVALVAVWIVWRFGLDILVSAAIALTPPVFVDQFDRGTLQTIDFTMAEPTKLDVTDQVRVEVLFDRLLEHVEDAPRGTEFTLLFRNMPGVGPNAFALPGGTVVMTDAFVKEFPDEDVLAGVLGHEIGHVVEQHGLRQVYRSLSIYLLIAFIAGDTGPILEDIILEGNVLLSLNYSRRHETAADKYGVELSDRAGFDPVGLKVFFKKIQELGAEPPEWMSTHPSSAGRVEAIDVFIDNLPR